MSPHKSKNGMGTMSKMQYKGFTYVESSEGAEKERPFEFKVNDSANLARNVIDQLKHATKNNAASKQRILTALRLAKKLVDQLSSLSQDES